MGEERGEKNKGRACGSGVCCWKWVDEEWKKKRKMGGSVGVLMGGREEGRKNREEE